jgi:hypothetical protein
VNEVTQGFLKALDALVNLHLEKTKMATTAATPKKNKFVAFLDKVGHGLKVGLVKVLPIAESAGEVAVSIFDPAASPLFNQTISAVLTAEQSAAAIPGGSTGPQKLAAVAQLMGPLIKQALADVGKPNDDTAVEKYISAVVTILNAIPAPAAPNASQTGSQAASGSAAAVPASPIAPQAVAAPAGQSPQAPSTLNPEPPISGVL